MSSLESFEQFPRLPPKIRRAIWQIAAINDCPVEPVACAHRPVLHSADSWMALPTTGDIPMPMPATMHVCKESRLVTRQQEPSIVMFDVDKDGACLNPHRKFRADVDLLYVNSQKLFGSANYGSLARFIKNNRLDPAAESEHEECLRGPIEKLYSCRVCLGTLERFEFELISRSAEGENEKTDIHKLMENQMAHQAHKLGFLFYAATVENGKVTRTAVRTVKTKSTSRLFNQATEEPTIVIGGDNSMWKFVAPDFGLYILRDGLWPPNHGFVEW